MARTRLNQRPSGMEPGGALARPIGMNPNTPPSPDRLADLLHDHYRRTLGAGAHVSAELDARILATLRDLANNDQR